MDYPPPLTWAIEVAALAQGPVERDFEASPDERAAVAVYLGVPEVAALRTHIRATPLSGGRYRAKGTVRAHLRQKSVVSLDLVDEDIAEPFAAEFWPASELAPRGEDHGATDVSPTDDVPEPIENDRLGIGRLTCELLAVAMEPYPRAAGESFVYEAGEDEQPPSPFAVLDKLKQPRG